MSCSVFAYTLLLVLILTSACQKFLDSFPNIDLGTNDSSSESSTWAISVGGDQDQENWGTSIAVDNSGNIYVAGVSHIEIPLPDGGVVSANAPQKNGIFITKMSSSGQHLWTTTASGATQFDISTLSKIALTKDNDIYVFGSFAGHLYFDSGKASISTTSPYSLFIAKITANGDLSWVVPFEGSSYIHAISMTVDNNDNPIVVGSFLGQFPFGTTTLSSKGNKDAFVAKMDSSAQPIWATSFGGPLPEHAIDVSVDTNTNVYIVGTFSSDFVIGETFLTSTGLMNTFVAKFNQNGQPVWAIASNDFSNAYINSITMDKNDNPYVTGGFAKKIPFGTSATTAIGINDVFVSKFNSDGHLVWISSASGTSACSGTAVVTDMSNNAYVVGDFNEHVIFGSSTITSAGQIDMFVGKISADGKTIEAVAANSLNMLKGLGIALDTNNNIYVTGKFSDEATFGTTTLTSKGKSDTFVWKLVLP